jgi:hypothetical protein
MEPSLANLGVAAEPEAAAFTLRYAVGPRAGGVIGAAIGLHRVVENHAVMMPVGGIRLLCRPSRPCCPVERVPRESSAARAQAAWTPAANPLTSTLPSQEPRGSMNTRKASGEQTGRTDTVRRVDPDVVRRAINVDDFGNAA